MTWFALVDAATGQHTDSFASVASAISIRADHDRDAVIVVMEGECPDRSIGTIDLTAAPIVMPPLASRA